MRKTTGRIWLWGILLWSTSLLYGQTEVLQVKIFGFEEGLSHRNVYKIQQDTYGFIWLSTINGLNKYDGYAFTRMGGADTPFQSPEGFVTDMVLDTANNIWLVEPNYLHHITPKTGAVQSIRVNTGSLERGAEQTINALHIDQNGHAWSATYMESQGLSLLQKYEQGEKTVEIELPGTYEHRPILSLNDTLYVGAFENELWKLDLNGQIIDKYSFPYRGYSQSSARIVDLKTVEEGKLYILLQNGTVYFKKKEADTFLEHPSNRLLSSKPMKATTFLPEKNGDVWIAGQGALWYYNFRNNQLKDVNEDVRELSKFELNYRQVFKDASGVIWIASEFGAIKIVRSNELFSTYLNGGNSFCSSGFCSIRGIAEDEKGQIYFSYYNSIHHLNPEDDQLRPFFPNTELVISPFGLACYEGALITGDGLSIDLKTRKVDSLLYDGIKGAEGIPFLDERGNLWLAHDKRLFILDESSNRFTRFQDQEGRLANFKHTFTSIHFGQRSGYLWLGTREHGVYYIDLEDRTLRPLFDSLRLEKELSNPHILAIYEDALGKLWLGTGGGVTQVDLVNQTTSFLLEKDGLPNNFVNGLLSEGDSAIWISTDNGLARYNLIARKLSTFYKRDGLPANEFNRVSFLKARDGRLYFGGLNGVTAFFPSSEYAIQKKKQESKILLTSFSKYDGELDSLTFQHSGFYANDGIRLSYKDRFFTFGFSLADYASPYQNLYSYKLEPYEESWSPPQPLNSARYNNIPAGEYTFKVRAATANNAWNSKELSIPIFIEQAYYRSPWFILTCFFFFLLGGYGFLRYRIWTIRKRERQLEEQVRVRTLELAREKKKSDDLLLNILPSETADELKATGRAKAKRHESVTVMFADIQDFTRIAEKLQPEKLVAEIDFFFRKFDHIMDKYGLEKIKTIGDAYLCVGGMPMADDDAAANIIRAALEMQDYLKALASERAGTEKPIIQMRIGIHTGPVVAGIVGIKKFAYDIWGDTVNIAARMESSGQNSTVNISESTYHLIKDQFHCTYRGKIKAKNKGEIDMYFVRGPILSK
jgi:class 3 adenylate cyclase/ligand-binding sensor domain-containing protein